MSVITKESIEVIAQTIGINNISPDVSLSLPLDVEYRVREIMQEAIKCMRHSMRTLLTCEDVDRALSLRNVEPLYSFGSYEGLQFKRAGGSGGLYYIEDKDVDFRSVVEAPLPNSQLNATVGVHWLAVEGVQPAIPENTSVEETSDGKKLEYKDENISPDLKFPGKHLMSRELQLYLEKLIELSTKRKSSLLFNNALSVMKNDSNIHLFLPYLTHYISSEVAKHSNDFSILFPLMRIAQCLVQNQHIHIEPYIHQLIPSIITCIITKGLNFSPNQWELRKFSANLIAVIWKRFGHVYHNLQQRITRTLLHVFLDPEKSFSQHYGAVQGLAALGPQVVRLILLPNLEPYLQILEPELSMEKQKDAVKRSEAQHVYGALMSAAYIGLYDKRKTLSPNLLPSSSQAVWKRSTSVLTLSNKRKLSTDNLVQPPLKKQQTEGGTGAAATKSLPTDVSGQVGGLSNPNSDIKSSQMARQSPLSTSLSQAWKEDVDAGSLLAALVPHFGESLLYFIPNGEMNLFL